MADVASPILLRKGAEASLFLADWHGREVVIKSRLVKRYRPAQLDSTIRHFRTVHEPQLMHEAKRAGVLTPLVFMVDVENAVIVMEYVEGQQVKQFLELGASAEEQHSICIRIGELIGRLHASGIVHGDLTTSNIILTPDGRIYFVDFGLGDRTAEFEARGVDMHLLKHALQSTHFQIADACFSAIVEGYAEVLGKEVTEKVLEKIREIERRGRYVAERRQET